MSDFSLNDWSDIGSNLRSRYGRRASATTESARPYIPHRRRLPPRMANSRRSTSSLSDFVVGVEHSAQLAPKARTATPPAVQIGAKQVDHT